MNPMPMLPIQNKFATEAALLILVAVSMGYQVSLGDAYRDERCDYGAKHSKHRKRLAIDLNLFKNGVYLKETSDHETLGRYWESRGGIWGGRFKRNDGNHYEWPFE